MTALEGSSGGGGEISAAEVDAAIAAAIAPYIETPVWTDAPLEAGLSSHSGWVPVSFTRIRFGTAYMVKLRGLISNSGAFPASGMLLMQLPNARR